jgi:MGT family glycosyltransferase
MATVMAYTALSPGHLYPVVAVMRALRSVGHDVVLAADEPLADGNVGGIAVSVRMDHEASAPSQPRRSGGEAIDVERFAERGAPIADRVREHIWRVRPDLLIVDPTLWGAMVAAEASKLPWAAVAHNPLTFRGTGSDLRGPGIRPPRGLLSRLSYSIQCRSMRARENAALLPVVNETRKQYGLPPIRNVWGIFERPPLILVNSAEPLEYPRCDWPKGLRFVGALPWEPSTEPSGVAHVVGGAPLVLISGSTVDDNAAPVSWPMLAVEALAEAPFRVIATLSGGPIAKVLPRNVQVLHYVPHSLLLPSASCVVCHGGWGTTVKALSHGVPVVVIPYGYDRLEVARRVERAGVGVMLALHEVTPESLRTAVHAAIACRGAAGVIARALRAAGGPRAAANHIEQLLARHRT